MNVKVFNCDKFSIIYKMHEMINGGLFQEGNVTFFATLEVMNGRLIYMTHIKLLHLQEVCLFIFHSLYYLPPMLPGCLKIYNKSIH